MTAGRQRLATGTAPGTPTAGYLEAYAGTDKKLHTINEDATDAILSVDGHGAAVHVNRTRTIWISPRDLGLGVGNLTEVVVAIMTDGVTTDLLTNTVIPDDFVSVSKLYLLVTGDSGANTNVKFAHMDAAASKRDATENRRARTDSIAAATKAVDYTAKNVARIDLTAMIDGLTLAAEDLLSLWIQRDGANASDTYNADLWVLGVALEYTADE